jgi:transcriptional regulator with XRE-family HTH domain
MSKERPRKQFFSYEDDYLTPDTLETPSARPHVGSLGQRISRRRQQRGLSLEDLASRTGLALDLLQKLEQDEYTPPLGELIRLGKALEMKMGYFISPAASRPYTIMRSYQRQQVARYASGSKSSHGYIYESLAPEKGDRTMEPFIVTLRPSDTQEVSTHDGQEFIYVLEGRLEARVGDHTEVLDAGDAIYYDSIHPHLVRCHGDQLTRILAVLTETK